MWHSAHHLNHHGGGNDCFDPGRDRWDRDFGHGQHHHGEHGWDGPVCHDGGGWGGGWGDPGCHDDGGWGGGWGDPGCHDGGRGLIGFDHNSFLVCH